jgi:hypothetical protein
VMRRETFAENVNRASDLRVKNRFTQEWLPLTRRVTRRRTTRPASRIPEQ